MTCNLKSHKKEGCEWCTSDEPISLFTLPKILSKLSLNSITISHHVNLFDFRKGRWFGSGESSICWPDCRRNVTSLQGNCDDFHRILQSHWHWFLSCPFGPKSNSNWQLTYNSHRLQCSQQSKINFNTNTLLAVDQGIQPTLMLLIVHWKV